MKRRRLHTAISSLQQKYPSDKEEFIVKKTVNIILSALLVLSLSACSGQTDSSSQADAGSSESSTAASGTSSEATDPTQMSGTVTVWTYDSMIPEFSEGFTDVYPNIELDVQVVPSFTTKLTQALTTGVNLPDVVTIESTDYGTFTNHPGLEVLSQEPYNAEQYEDLFIDFWWQAGYSLNGELRIMPNAPGMGCTYYRRDLAIEGFGTDDDTELEQLLPDLETVIELQPEFKEKTGADLMPGADYVYQLAVKQTGNTLLDGETMTFDANVLREPLELALKAVEAGMAPTSETFADGMKNGTWFMYNDGSWGELYTLKAILGTDENGNQNQEGLWGVMSTPGGNVNKGGNGYAIISSSPNKEASWEYIKYMTMTVEVQESLLEKAGSYPGLIEAQSTPYFQEEDPFFNNQKARLKYGELAEDVIIIPITPYDYSIELICNKYVGPVLQGTMSIDDAINEIAAEVKREIQINVIPDV